MGLCELSLFRRADGTNNCHTEVLQPLAGDQTAAASRCMEQNCFTSFDRIGATNQILDRTALEHDGGGLLIRYVIRNLHELVRSDYPTLRVTAEAHAVGHTVTNRRLSHTVPNCFNDASTFISDGRGK